jgi:FkbM family methyltransferase
MFFKKTFSYEGEDQLIQRFFAKVKKGFYLDIGANHPVINNNTYLFYQMGWQGVCVDALDFSKLYKKKRPKDLFLNMALSNKKKKLEFYIRKDKTQSSIYKNHLKKKMKITSYKSFTSSCFEDLLSNFKLPDEIHFMSLDIEGSEKSFLETIDFKKYRIGLIVVEDKHQNMMKIYKSDIFKILTQAGYFAVCKSLLSTFYMYPNKEYFSFLSKKIFI